MTAPDIRAQFNAHLARYMELQEEILKARAEVAARLRIMEGLADLDPSLEPLLPARIGQTGPLGPIVAPVPQGVSATRPARGMEMLRLAFRGFGNAAVNLAAVMGGLDLSGFNPGPPKNVRRALERATELGLVERLDDPNDRRANLYRWIGPTEPQDLITQMSADTRARIAGGMQYPGDPSDDWRRPENLK